MGRIHLPDGTILEVQGEAGDVSDGYHTFNELYDHRIALFIALMHSHPAMAWRSKLHSDGTMYEGWFVAGMDLPSGPITYHMPAPDWKKLEGVKELDRAPDWDGHTPAQVLSRLNQYANIIAGHDDGLPF